MTARDAWTAVCALALVLGAAVALDPVLLGPAWRWAVLPAVVVALTVAVAGRALRAGAALTAGASLVVWVVVTYIVHLEAAGLLPGPDQARELAALWGAGMADLVREPAPVDAGPGLLLLLATVAWWMTHAVHEVLARTRTPALSILLAGVLWGVPLAVPQPPTRTWPHVVPFLAAAGLVLLVHASPGVRSVRRRPVPATGAALGVAAILLGTGAPALLPGYGESAWVDLRQTSAARGYQPIVDVTRRLQLPAPRDLLVVDVDTPVYLRLAGLDTFDGGTWKLGPGDDRTYTPSDVVPGNRPLPLETEIREREMVTARVENLALENVFVPAPYHPVRLGGTGAGRMVFSREGSFLATSEVTEGEPALVPGMTYEVEAAVPRPSAASLAGVGWDALGAEAYAPWTALPRDYPEIAALATAIRTEAGAESPIATALAIQAHFREEYRYSTDVPALRGSDALARFVLEDRVGYCEYFATAMAVMLRLEGIPARVAVGFRLGHELEPGRWLVTTDHAHAWVEALFPGYGWIQFEPTPALPDALVPTASNPAPTSPVGTDPQPPQEAPAPTDPATDPTLPDPGTLPDAPELGGPGGGSGTPDGRSVPRTVGVLLGLLVAGLAVAGATSLAAARRARPRPDLEAAERVLAAQSRVFVEAYGHGVGRRSPETAQEVAIRWTGEGRVHGPAATRLAALAQAAAFGGPLDERAGEEAERLAETLVADLRASAPRVARVVGPVRAASREVALRVGAGAGR